MRDENRLEYLFHQCIQGLASEEEQRLFLSLMQAPENQQLAQTLWRRAFEEEKPLVAVSPELSQSVFNAVLAAAPATEIENATPVVELPRRRGWMRWTGAAAAAILLAAVGGLLLHKKEPSPEMVKSVPLSPGGNKAVLTLADNTQIILDSATNGTLAQQGGIRVVKLKDGSLAYQADAATGSEVLYNTLTTPRGGEYQVLLPDGSRVWLNAASSIRYPNRFAGNSREVEVQGEAYFDIAADNGKPFLVHAHQLDVQVLGTEFNLMAYTDEAAIQATLVNGAVKVLHNNESMLLKPGQQARLLQGQQTLQSAQPNMQQVLAWRQGEFRFNGADIESIMRQIARWYDVEVVYQGTPPAIAFSGVIPKKQYATQLLEALELTQNIHFEIQGRKVIVIPGKR